MAIKQEFIKMIEGLHCPDLDGLVEALGSTRPGVSIRHSRLKGVPQPAGADMVPWSGGRGVYLAERPLFTLDPALHQGRYYVQEASSMIVGELTRRLTAGIDRPLRYLDACAAPGGKTTDALDSLPGGSVVVANEFVGRRAAVLDENLTKWGAAGRVVSRGDTRRYAKLRGAFDLIAVDAPCSGEGMFRKEPEAVEQWTPALVAECAARQREILTNVWGALRPGGYLIYSTCTFNRLENEEIVAWMVDELGAEPVDVELPAEWGVARGIATPYPCYRMLPHRLRGEGLFAAVVRRPGDEPAAAFNARQPRADRSLEPLGRWLAGPDDFVIEKVGESVRAVPAAHYGLVKALEGAVDVVSAGVEVATVKGRDYAPAHALAMSGILGRDAFPMAEVGLDVALSYLRREAVTLDGCQRGYVALTYGGLPLGFVKNLGNRANNLYPQAWRILKR